MHYESMCAAGVLQTTPPVAQDEAPEDPSVCFVCAIKIGNVDGNGAHFDNSTASLMTTSIHNRTGIISYS